MRTITKQEENALFHGFNDTEIISLYKFLCAYDKIESFKRDDAFKRLYPEPSKKLYEIIEKMDLKVEYGFPIITEPNKARFTDANGRSKNLAFLNHLRNSIGHGYIRKNDQIVIKDLWNGKFSASGNIDTDKFEEIINNINSILL